MLGIKRGGRGDIGTRNNADYTDMEGDLGLGVRGLEWGFDGW